MKNKSRDSIRPIGRNKPISLQKRARIENPFTEGRYFVRTPSVMYFNVRTPRPEVRLVEFVVRNRAYKPLIRKGGKP